MMFLFNSFKSVKYAPAEMYSPSVHEQAVKDWAAKHNYTIYEMANPGERSVSILKDKMVLTKVVGATVDECYRNLSEYYVKVYDV